MANYTVIWSPMARLTYLEILEYLQDNWPEKVTENFIARTEEVLEHIAENPDLYIYSNITTCYRCVVVKQISLFYRVKNKSAELLIFWDNRQNPEKLLSYM